MFSPAVQTEGHGEDVPGTSIEVRWLLPPSVQELVPPGHVAHFVRELARGELDLSAIFAA